ncbi:MAG: D-alanyl-D-alanine carboxypeptidase [Clostridiales bacterium]|nr:D-alanyl-D-alanine carboxypeptidase [Clostridiales bacterium]
MKNSKLYKHIIRLPLCLFIILCTCLLGINAALAEGNSDFTKPILDNGPEITSNAAIVMDINSGAVLYGKNTTGRIQPSSLTKLVTAAVAVDRLDGGSNINVSLSAASQTFPTASNAGLKSGQTISASDALAGMLCISAEDCTVAIAEKISGTQDAFAELMNSYAKSRGYVNSHFTNPAGRANADNYSCVYDLALTASGLMKNYKGELTPLFSAEHTLTSVNKKIKNTHRFINGTEKVANVYAGKTGGSAYGGDGTWAVCTFASKGNLNIVCIIAGAAGLSNAYEDTKLLFDYSFNNYESRSAASLTSARGDGIEKLFSSCPVFTLNDGDRLSTDEASYITLPVGASMEEVTRNVIFNEEPARFNNGYNLVGSIAYSYKSKYVGSYNIYYYTENGTISESDFINIFPGFLISPDTVISGVNDNTPPEKKTHFTTRVMRVLYSMFTPAKLYAAILWLLIFSIGVLVIFLILPVRESISYEGLYNKSIEDSKSPVLPEDELSEVTRMRKTDDAEMHEIT